MESQPQNPEFRINPESFHPCIINLISAMCTYLFHNPLSSFENMFKIVKRSVICLPKPYVHE